MLATAYHARDDVETMVKSGCNYKPTHANHPMSKWVRQSPHNFNWACDHALALINLLCPTHKCKPYIEYFKSNPVSFEDDDKVFL